jgi:beta-carotene hydroxylase
MPFTGHRHEHLAHHRGTNDPSGDPDYVIRDLCRSAWHTLRSSVLFIHGQLSYFQRYCLDTAPAAQKRRFWMEILFSWTLRLTFIFWLGWEIGLWLLVVGPLLGSLITQYLFSYLVHHPHEALGRYVNTATYLVPGWSGKWLTLAWGYQNYHSIHHLFPRIPFYRYPALFKRIEPVMLIRGAPVYRLGRSGWQLLRPAEHALVETSVAGERAKVEVRR